jgi:dipeptidyl-peptidase-4
VLTHAAKLERPLFVCHGTADDNVFFAHAAKVRLGAV